MFPGSRAGAAHQLAVATLLLFLGIAGLEHALVPGLDPARHMISEYVNGGYGAPMIAGFLAWAASLATTAILAARDAGSSPRTAHRNTVVVLLAIAAAGMGVTAAFATQTSAGVLPPGVHLSTSGRLHDLGSGLTTLALFAAVVASLRAIDGPTYHARALTILLIAVATDAGLLAVGPSVGGIRERGLLLCGCAWQLALLAALQQRRQSPRDRRGGI